MTMTRNQLRAARMLLSLSQEELAALSSVGVATIRRYESGMSVTEASVGLLRATVEAAGAVLLGGAEVSGRRIGDGVALAAKLPPQTVRRLGRISQAGTVGRPGRPRKARSDPQPERRSGKAAPQTAGERSPEDEVPSAPPE